MDEGAVQKLVQQTVLWKGKLEAAFVFVELDQPRVAAKLMVDAIKAVEGSKNSRVILEAILGVSPHLAKLDPGRARFLLGLAAKSAENMGRLTDRDLARKLLAELPAAPSPASPQAVAV